MKTIHQSTGSVHTARQFLQRYVLALGVVVVIALVVLFNVHRSPTLLGFDTFAPFFSSDVTLHRILNTGNFFEFGGLAFNIVSLVLAGLRLPVWVVSQTNVWLPFIAGSLGVLMLLQLVRRKVATGGENSEARGDSGKREMLGALLLAIGLIAALGSLVTQWIFSQPNLIFLNAFAGVPLFVLFLLTPDVHSRSKQRQKFSLKLFSWKPLLVVYGLLCLFVTSLNLVAFLLYVMEGIAIALALNAALSVVTPRAIVMKSLTVVGIWIAAVQIILLISPAPRFIGTEIYDHLQTLTANPVSAVITEDLRASELQNNSLLNVTRFATGWLELHVPGEGPVFEHYDVYMNSPLFVLIGLTPVLVCLLGAPLVLSRAGNSPRGKKQDEKNWKWLYGLLALSALVMTSGMIVVLGEIPYIRDGLRWISSKLWPLYFYPLVILFVLSLWRITAQYSRKVQVAMLAGCGLILAVYAFPWWTGPVVSDQFQVDIPDEYEEVFGGFNENDRVLYLPAAQELYFRKYDWGYFGSDFISYMTNAEVVDNAGLATAADKYAEMREMFENCNWYSLAKEGITHVVYDSSVSGAILPACLDVDGQAVPWSEGELTIYPIPLSPAE